MRDPKAQALRQVPLFARCGSKELEFVEAAKMRGEPSLAIMVREVLPNCWRPITATWANVASPTAKDWIGLYKNSTDAAYLTYVYTGGGSSGSKALTVPAGTPLEKRPRPCSRLSTSRSSPATWCS